MQTKNSKKRAIITTIVALVTLLVIILIVYSITSSVADSRLQKAIQAVKDSGETLNFEDLKPESIPDEDNASTFLKQAFEKYKEIVDYYDGHDLRDFLEHKTEASPDMIQNARQFLELNADCLDSIEEAISKDKCNFNLDYSNPLTMNIPAPEIMNINLLLNVQRVLAICDKNYKEAINSSCRSLKIASFLDVPTFISHLVKITIIEHIMKDLQVIVENSEMSEHSLQELLKFLKLNEPYQELSKILIGERSVGNFAFELLKNGTLEEQEEIFGETITVITDAIKLDQAFYINEMTKAVNLSRQPFYQIKEELSEFVSESYPWYASFTSIMMPSIINVFERSVWTSNSLLVAEIAIKSKIHYLRHGKFPKDLSELVTEKLIDEIPIDPYTGKPLGVTAWKFKY